MNQSTQKNIPSSHLAASLAAYIPMDRRFALAEGRPLPDRTSGAALFADVSGFTQVSAVLADELGPQQGAEELTGHLNRVFGALIAEVHHYHGSVVSFAGDAITCWFDRSPPPKTKERAPGWPSPAPWPCRTRCAALKPSQPLPGRLCH
jgi:class 3 adenylate cyclase